MSYKFKKFDFKRNHFKFFQNTSPKKIMGEFSIVSRKIAKVVGGQANFRCLTRQAPIFCLKMTIKTRLQALTLK